MDRTVRGKWIAVLGGAGLVGEACVSALLDAGAHVLAADQDSEGLAGLAAAVLPEWRPRLHTVHGFLDNEGGVIALEAAFRALTPRLDGAIASIGGWWHGRPLLNVSLEEWNRVLTQRLTTHFLAARTLLPRIAESPTGFYFLMSGGVAHEPLAESGPVCVATAGQAMLARMLAVECAGLGVRICELALHTPVVTRRWQGKAQAEWVTGEEVGALVVGLAERAEPVPGPILHVRSREDMARFRQPSSATMERTGP